MGWNDWIRTVEVEPSLYAADFARLGEQVDVLLSAGVRVFHFDVGDGHFVEPITMGPIVLQSISQRIHDAGAHVDCHLMTEYPEKYFAAIRKAGGDSVTVHYEACDDLAGVSRLARENDLQFGVAFKPQTDPTPATEAARSCGADIVLCMSIEPGYSGQKFMPDALDRLRTTRSILPDGTLVQVDGGIDSHNVKAAHEAGAALLVAGTSIFGTEDIAAAYHGLVQQLG